MWAILFFVLSLSFSATGQYWQKRAALHLMAHQELSFLQKLSLTPVILAIGFMLLSAFTWLGVLTQWDVSLAYPLLSINFVIIFLLSQRMFKEVISRRQWLGLFLVIAGVVILAKSA